MKHQRNHEVRQSGLFGGEVEKATEELKKAMYV